MGAPVRDGHDVSLQALTDFCAAHPVEVALMAEHVLAMEHDPSLRDHLLCFTEGGVITGVCWIGGNIVPVGIRPEQVPGLIREIRRRGRRYSSIVGPAEQVQLLWAERGAFGPARQVRGNQPSLEMNSRPALAPDPLVAPTTLADMDVIFPAAVAMFTEEVGYSPLGAGGGYERRVRSLVAGGRSLSRIEQTPHGREVIFKADLGTVGFGVTQVQGVWVNPRYRGRGISAPAMAAVVNYAHQNFAPTVSLYVNDYNHAALATYARVGFVRTGTFATILY